MNYTDPLEMGQDPYSLLNLQATAGFSRLIRHTVAVIGKQCVD